MTWHRSLAFRVIAFSTIWAVIALVVIATIISALFRQASEAGFQSLLSAQLFNLISAVSISDDGRIQGDPDLGDLRYTIPNSGWYWSVEPASAGVSGELRSVSMQGDIEPPTAEEAPFNFNFQRRYRIEGLNGEELQVLESEFALGDDDRVARFRIMGNRSALEAETAAFDREIYLYLGVFGFGMIAINVAAILLGLRPLGQVREALARVRQGAAQQLDGTFPVEIAPLANETNALIENNRRIVERSRTQVGNLAHSLKTPLAVLANEGRALGGKRGGLIVEQADQMRQQVDHYLQRARIAAQRDSIVYRTPVAPVLTRMGRVIERLNPHLSVTVTLPDAAVVFAGEQQDLEEVLGNLLENAGKWAREHIEMSLLPHASTADADHFAVVIEDDGPGIPADKAAEALKRGARLDETKPGTGLGLSIVSDLVNEYGGSLSLDGSPKGGLRVTVRLRRAK